MFNPPAARARCEAIIGARRAQSQLMTDDPKLTLEYLALTDLPAALEHIADLERQLAEAQGKLEAVQGCIDRAWSKEQGYQGQNWELRHLYTDISAILSKEGE